MYNAVSQQKMMYTCVFDYNIYLKIETMQLVTYGWFKLNIGSFIFFN